MMARRFVRRGTTWSMFALASVFAAAPWVASAQNYLPLSVENQWIYSGLQGGIETWTVTGTVWIRGHEASIIRYGPSSYNEGLENYWSTSPDGDVLLHGFNRTLDPGWIYIYDPPIVMLDAPLALGRSWTQTVTYYTGPDTIPEGDITLTRVVLEAGALAVPAGTFNAYGIGYSPTSAMGLASAGSFSVTGNRITASSTATDWWADGIGQMKYTSDQDYVLASFGGPTATGALTWGGLKALYRR